MKCSQILPRKNSMKKAKCKVQDRTFNLIENLQLVDGGFCYKLQVQQSGTHFCIFAVLRGYDLEGINEQIEIKKRRTNGCCGGRQAMTVLIIGNSYAICNAFRL